MMVEGATRSGTEFVAVMPDWYDSQGRFLVSSIGFIICHPDHPPHCWNGDKWVALEIKASD